MLFAAAAAVALLLAGYSAFWWMMADRLAGGLDIWIAAEKQAGLTIAADRAPIAGYPFTFKATFRNPHVTGTLAGQPVDWQGDDVDAWLWPFDLRTLLLATTGDHRVVIGSAQTAIHADALKLLVHFDPRGAASQVTAESGAMTVTLPGNRPVTFQSAQMSFDAPAAAPQSDRDPLLQFSVSAAGLKLPADVQLLTADPVDTIAIAGTIKGPMPRAPLKQALAGWRDAGGAAEITAFNAAQGPLAVSGTATIALDAELQPIIAANVAAKGMGPTTDLLARQKRIAAKDVFKLKLFIAATEQPAPGGGKQVTSGVTIQNGVLYLGPFKIARVARIDWP
jgi:hypothetical protein